jgi:flagellar hook-associated protein 3 FlgL
MIRSIDPTTDAFLTALNRVSSRIERAQTQIASGKRMTTISDDASGITPLLEARAGIGATNQIQSNLGYLKTEVDGAEQSLAAATKLMDRVRVLGAQGNTSTATADQRTILAGEVGSILEQLGGISATNIQGRYLFSGDSDHTPPYTIDLTAADPIGTYAGSAATRQVQHPNGSRFSVAHTAQQIFDDPQPANNVFHSVLDLRNALLANDSTAILAAVGRVNTAATHLNGEQAFYGNIQNKITEAQDFGSRITLKFKEQASSLEDADPAESILELQQGQTQQQAALTARARVPRTSLFDYLG